MINGECDDFREHIYQPVRVRACTSGRQRACVSPMLLLRGRVCVAASHIAFVCIVTQQVTRAGDVIIWSEATVHGATPWRGAHERRIALYRFAPPNMGYGRGYLEIPPEKLARMPPQVTCSRPRPGSLLALPPLHLHLFVASRIHLQVRAVLEPPYSTRLERPLVTAESAEEPLGPPAKVRPS